MVPGVGSQVAGYRIDGLVGRGGGGVVYRATHRRLGRTDALKLLAPELATDREFQRRFEREAMMAGALDHPHIIPVYDAGEADGVLYLAMRLVKGPDLATLIETANGRLEPKRACAILSQVASALDAAHNEGLVHRDVKPGNILVDHVANAGGADRVYLSDFGLTRRFEGSALSGTMVAGTPWYMAPERFRGVPSAPAIDVYALGCVAYACLIGSPPFNGDSFESVMAGHLYEAPPRISDHRTDVPAGVDAVLAKAVAKEAVDRFPSCGAFATALRDAINAGATPSDTSLDPPAPAAHPRSSRWPSVPTPVSRITRRHKIVGASVVVAVVAALVALAVPWSGTPVAPAQGSATATRLIGTVNSLAIDPAGGVYLGNFADDPRILKVEPSGTIRTIAGTGTKGYSGDHGPARKAQLWSAQGLAVDGAGNLYIADTGNHRVRKIDSAGTITTIAGNGTQDSTGDGGPAAQAQFRFPVDIAIDRSGNIYVAEAEGRRVRKIDQNSQITTVAGTGVEGFSGDGGPAAQAQLGFPLAIAVDDSGNLYIVDSDRIRKVDASGTITSIAGTGAHRFTGDGGPATAAELNGSEGVAADHAGSIYIADSNNNRIRKIDAGGRISTIAGSGTQGFSGDGGPATTAQLASPTSVAVDRDSNIYIGDQGNHRVRKVDQNGTISTLAGTGPSYPGDGLPATQAVLQYPKCVDFDKVGRLYIVDSMNHRLRRVNEDGKITTIAGSGVDGFSGDGSQAVDAQLNQPGGFVIDPAGNVYIADMVNHRVRKVTPDGKITTFSGIGRGSFSGDNGPATAADLRFPIGLALGSDGSLYIAEGGNDRIRRVDPAGIITTVVGNGARGISGDGGPAAQAQLFAPGHIHFDRHGNLFIADRGNNRIRRVDPAGIITTVAGNGAEGFSGDGGPARDARLNFPWAVTVDDMGNLYIADTRNSRIRKVDPNGAITTIAGTSVAGFSGDDGPATRAQLEGPVAVSIGADQALYIADHDNNRIRKIDTAGIITTVAGPQTQ